ncbi:MULTISPECIES: dUTP diphosphatase [unclassified Enterococcus]|uniref:dUTP diphosphatase n=1 Tax=unclassified Enterococcus TaxID=2608891 RepID=UPI001556E0DD|nr:MULTISPECIES: dUTP diphosphatase [unclassified Enterococcus]MBS7578209.1 dUTP diphosphatase [Enterococcus sp. MMGLQ5-2]MBS7585415.1 dUTP diphosphatase [Enterococcus sp. MMGLQ5-1]NPD13272.1 dUTP diphosphatase [Enterococcus sp. MMGLQ5-1]NPD38040.1 dUTP diphosphatase [Enterococcus sp. MMGLQ5-2]
MTRGFEVIKAYENQSINLPARATKCAAGYDFEAGESIEIPSFWTAIFNRAAQKPTLVPTGIKSYMQPDEYLELANRSSNPLKRFLIMSNGVGVIDQDYYNNPENEGHIMFQFWNFSFKTVKIEKGERIGQGIFKKFLKADHDSETEKEERTSGHGSTGVK